MYVELQQHASETDRPQSSKCVGLSYLPTVRDVRVLLTRNAGSILLSFYRICKVDNVLSLALRMFEASMPCGIRYFIRFMSKVYFCHLGDVS